MKRKTLLLSCVGVIFAIGLVMIFNATAAEELDKSLEPTSSGFIRQLIFGAVGILVGFFIYRAGYKKLLNFSPYFLWGVALLLLLVFLPKIGQEINGAKRWIGFHGLTIQPSEFAKCIVPLFFLARVPKDLKEFIRMLCTILPILVLIFIEPDNGTVIILLSLLVVLCFLTKIRPLFWALPLFFCVCVGGIAAYKMPYVSERIQVYLHPELDLRGKGHQPHQAKIAAGSGGFFGRGLGESMQKMSYLPEARSDYLAAIYAEEFGFFGILILVLLYMTLTFAGFWIATSVQDPKGAMLAGVLTFLIAFQAFLNLGVVSGLLPSKGTTLPFFSLGGTSLIVNFIAIALLLSIDREKAPAH